MGACSEDDYPMKKETELGILAGMTIDPARAVRRFLRADDAENTGRNGLSVLVERQKTLHCLASGSHHVMEMGLLKEAVAAGESQVAE
jgi:hypothetical protein